MTGLAPRAQRCLSIRAAPAVGWGIRKAAFSFDQSDQAGQRSPPRRQKTSTSCPAVRCCRASILALRSEQPLTQGGLEKPCLDGVVVIVLADHRNTVITEQRPRSLQ